MSENGLVLPPVPSDRLSSRRLVAFPFARKARDGLFPSSVLLPGTRELSELISQAWCEAIPVFSMFWPNIQSPQQALSVHNPEDFRHRRPILLEVPVPSL